MKLYAGCFVQVNPCWCERPDPLRFLPVAARLRQFYTRCYSVGPVLRKLRPERGESLATVARAADVSIGFLSNLERSQTNVSIGAMRMLAEAKRPLVRASERRILRGGEGVQMELLASGKVIMEPDLFRIAPSAGSGEFYSHDGEEFFLDPRTAGDVFEDREFRLSAAIVFIRK